MIKKILNFKFVIPNCNRGMTYVELIVVLSIFSVLSSVTIFNYKQFQLKVDIKNLAHDITLKIVEAQKSATSGKLAPPPPAQQPPNPLTWKPSYGLYFNRTTPTTFYYFIDLDQNKQFVPPTLSCPTEECLENNPIYITKGNSISQIKIWQGGPPSSPIIIVNDLQITFTRPNSGATFATQASGVLSSMDRAEITVSSPSGDVISIISIYPSGRIELN